jgi:apolipoprotein N-acyltransferase
MKQNHQSILLFLLGFGIFMFTRRSEVVPTIPVAIVIAPILILRFGRILPRGKGILLTLLGFVLSMNIALWGLFDLNDQSTEVILGLIRSTLLAILWFLPFMIDRFVYPRFKGSGVLSTLTFPMITTAIFFLSSLEGPFDGAGMSSKFVDGFVFSAFTQALSVFGVWIFVFIASWFASLISYAWEEGFIWKRVKKSAFIFLSVLLAMFLFGMLKPSLSTKQGDVVKIAAIVLIPEDGKTVSMENIWAEKLYSPFEETLSRIENLTFTAAENEARIISFQEHAITIDTKDEARLRREYQRIARENHVYLSITYSYYSNTEKGENKHLLIDDGGEVLLDYSKRYLLGIGKYGETMVFKKGPEIIQAADTPYGKIGISICRDMDFLAFIRQAGKSKVDIMLSPSYDFPKSTEPSYLLRTVENGFSFIRPTYNGVSYAADCHGKVLTQMDSDETETGIMYASVSTKGIRTLYASIGDLFGWMCLLGVFALAIASIRRQVSH